MEEAIEFFRAFELWIYLLLGMGGLIYMRKFVLAWKELQEAIFGLEREGAQTRLNHAARMLVLLLILAMAEFVLVSFVAPAMPQELKLATPTANLLATPTLTLPASILLEEGTTSPTEISSTATLTLSGCIPGQIEIFFPKNGQEISGVVKVTGTASIPNFGFYKFEIRRPGEAIWLTIQAGNSPVVNGDLGDWDTRRLIPGEYELGLVVVDNAAQAYPPCIITVRVLPTAEATLSPQ